MDNQTFHFYHNYMMMVYLSFWCVILFRQSAVWFYVVKFQFPKIKPKREENNDVDFFKKRSCVIAYNFLYVVALWYNTNGSVNLSVKLSPYLS